MALEFFDDFFRLGAIAFLLWAACLLARYMRQYIQARLAVISGICVACMLVTTGYDQYAMFGRLGSVLVMLAELNIAFTWLFCLSLFFDNFRMRPWHWLILGYYFVVWLSYSNDYSIILNDIYVSRAVRAIIYGYLIYVAIRGRSGDLIEERRSFRIWFAIAVIAATAIVSFAELYYDSFYEFRLLQSSTIFLVVIGFISHVARVSDTLFFATVQEGEAKRNQSDVPADEMLIAEDRHSLGELESLMQAGAYAEPGITIAVLAEKIRMPEHRLRRLINHHLGHRNFSQFLNTHRVAAAKYRLSNVEERHVPILTIAMDVGYMSLGPFNRAFKKQTDQTPSEYRRNMLEGKMSD